MNKAKIKKHFKALLKKELDGRFKYITKPFHWSGANLIFLENEIYIAVSYAGHIISYDCLDSYVPVERIGQYKKLVSTFLEEDFKDYNWYNNTTFKRETYGVVNSEEKLEEIFYKDILPKINNVHILRGKRIQTIADCYELQKSGCFIRRFDFMFNHLLFAKLIDPLRGKHIETLLKEEILPQEGIEDHQDALYYLEDEKFGPIFKKLCNLNQEEELESGRLLESDLVVTTRNEEWPTIDPEFEEKISPKYKELLYGK